jgi:hypothetical protein
MPGARHIVCVPRAKRLQASAALGFALAVTWFGCGDDSRSPEATTSLGGAGLAGEGSGGGSGEGPEPGSAGASGTADSGVAGSYLSGDSCLPGLTRCHGQLGFQSCTPEGEWGESHTCGGYSENGTSSYCALVDSGADPWAACVDPACWWWIESGLLTDDERAGVCVGSESLRPCHPNGTLARAVPCVGTCRELGQLDGRRLGFCDPACREGERECLVGPLYRECVGRVWSAQAKSCEGDEPCLPLGSGAQPDIKCGGPCELGTSRCTEDAASVETCRDGAWEPAPCLLGRCVRAGAQAQCQTECRPDERACAFDGDGAAVVCNEIGLWSEPVACTVGTTCRVGTAGALGCLACVGASTPGGNAWGVADSRCDGSAVAACGEDNAYQTPTACTDDQACVEVARGASLLAYCQ